MPCTVVTVGKPQPAAAKPEAPKPPVAAKPEPAKPQPAARPEQKPDAAPKQKPAPKPDLAAKPDPAAKPQAKPQAKPDAKPDTRPDGAAKPKRPHLGARHVLAGFRVSERRETALRRRRALTPALSLRGEGDDEHGRRLGCPW